MKTNANDPINPTPIAGGDGSVVSIDYVSGTHSGLTKREYFAAQILQGFCSNHTSISKPFLVMQAVSLADLLINELNNRD